ncbi:hypothetical protein EWM64_g4020 [Hericium alpestre]|uniref:Nodulin-like domain-containing protein n=1 Tax=Hericium alpestre TaxID=135208 RepID=A0A4Z0A100_9AGAM|nr:hypothetical protein EWM64_g4020 [Hericium alpestre]
MASDSSLLQRARLVCTCCSIAANAICAGGIFTFPLLSPALATHLKLTQPQLTTIVLAGMIGQYPFAAVVGKVIDRHGPWACSLVSSILFSFGFGMFAHEIAKTPDDITYPSKSSFHRLVFFFFLAGLGTVFSYFSSLFAASKNFPNYMGVASGSSMALFGLSPLFLSLLAKPFSRPDTDLDVTAFLTFLAALAGTVHLIGAFTLHVPPLLSDRATISEEPVIIGHEDLEEASTDERQALLPGKGPQVSVDVVPVEEDATVLDLLKDPNFYILALITMLVLGSCEMVISNIGTIVLSLPPSSASQETTILDTATDVATSTQVRVLSLANTASRLLAGPLADFTSPVAAYLPSGIRSFPRKHFFSRIGFLSGATLLLAISYASLVLGIRSQGMLWILSIGTGVAYGTTFTILPSVVSSVWGSTNLGRNFGVLTYAPFLGTPLFSYLYAFISASRSSGEGVCTGVACWRLTFWDYYPLPTTTASTTMSTAKRLGAALLHASAAATMVYGYNAMSGTPLDDYIMNQRCGHTQFLTIQALAMAVVTMLLALANDVFPSLKVFRQAKRTLAMISLPLEVVVSIIYWGLILFAPGLILQSFPTASGAAAPPFHLRTDVDLALHALPSLALTLDFVLFERKYSPAERIPYPFLTVNPFSVRIVIYLVVTTMALLALRVVNALRGAPVVGEIGPSPKDEVAVRNGAAGAHKREN